MNTEHDLLTITEVAELTRTPVATLRYWRHLGKGPHSFRLGRHIRYYRHEVHEWIREQKTISTSRHHADAGHRSA